MSSAIVDGKIETVQKAAQFAVEVQDAGKGTER
jgi:hypothetical protein